MIDSWPSSLSLTLQVAVLFFSLVLALWILRHQLRDFVDHCRHFISVQYSISCCTEKRQLGHRFESSHPKNVTVL